MNGTVKAVSPIKVMIVDAQKSMRSIVRSLLLHMGVKDVTEAENGHQAVEKLGDFMPDVIITDLHMDVMDGMQLIAEIRRGKTPAERNQPIIILTGDKDPLLREVAEQVGATKFLMKPVAVDVLKQAIAESIGYDFCIS